ncbi:MAG: rubrerythrin [Firmicutes bacterium]|nr:rubrerythrin [Alicyclobacillaceae bacterium]MCL6496555.1 rubrerythrin [Bacillota bacterium]
MQRPSSVEVVTWLNLDLRGEHDAIVHYLQHAWVLSPWGPTIMAIARDEMRHLKWLAHTIVRLGGTPDLTPPPIRRDADPLAQDEAAEAVAIEQYRRHRADIPDPAIQSLLDRIVIDEEDHLRQFRALREKAGAVPLAPSSELDPEARAFQPSLTQLMGCEYAAVLSALHRAFQRLPAPRTGIDWEDQAVEEMHHLSWAAETLARHGLTPEWPEPAPGDSRDEAQRWEMLARAAHAWDPEAAALAHRAARREALEAHPPRRDRSATVGSLATGRDWVEEEVRP